MDAVRGRIRRGKLEAEHGEHGTVYVFVDAEGADGRGPSRASQGPSPTAEGQSGDDARLVDALEDRISSLERQLEAERAANRENRRLLAAALERIPAIEAPEPRGGPQTDAEASEGTHTPEAPTDAQEAAQEPETARRSWWVRIFGG